MGEQLFLERFFWFDTEAKKNHFPNASHHLVNYMGAWHLVAFCRMRNDWRDFRRSEKYRT